jgi:serine phosphatase RsbU (regulator of sigma subunit)
MNFRVLLACTLFFFLWSARGLGQTEVIIYDGSTGIAGTIIRNDTARVATLLPGSPAEKAGIRFLDQILAINDSAISGPQLNQRLIKDLLRNRSGEPIDLLINRKGVDSLLHFSFSRAPYLNQIPAFEYEYLIDSLDQLDMAQADSGLPDSLFTSPLIAKIRVYSVEPGSPAEELGILPGDLFVSLQEEVDREYYYQISNGPFLATYRDTSVTVLRGDSLIHFALESSLGKNLKGIESQFAHDFSCHHAWLKVKTVNRLAESRTYVINLPEMSGMDTAVFFFPGPSGTFVEKRAGVLLPMEERDYVYKDWHAVTLTLDKDAEQTFYIHWISMSGIGAPYMQFIALETMVKQDRIERMIRFSLLGMMLIISCFFGILYVALRNLQYLYFSLYILFFAAFLFVTAGYLAEFQWNKRIYASILISGAQAFSLSLATICFLLFGNDYLDLKQKLSGWYWSVIVLLGLIGVRVLVMLLGSILGFEIGEPFENLVLYIWALAVGFIPLFLLLIPAILRIRSGFRPAWYFLVANVVLIPLAIITVFASIYSYSALNLNESMLLRIFKVSGVYVAAVIQILIFSIGLARKMRQDEEEKKKAQKQIIDQLKENEKLKDKVNRELEQKVQERTREIIEQKEEIESQRDEIEAQRDLLFAQKKEITDSIGYAQRIQAAILPHPSFLDRIIPEYFVLYKPRDIVSGDFYWIKEIDSSLVIVVADCTGHGVPGAFMSMLGITLLNELFVEGRQNQPAGILEELRSKVKAMLVQEGHITDQKDGMDMAMAVINRETKELQFAGAYNPLYLIRERKELTGKEPGPEAGLSGNGSLLFELKGDRQPIGIHWEETGFRNQVVGLKEKDTVYVFSDGYLDQYGGEQKKKFKSRQFKELLLSIHSEPMEKQKQILEKAFESWRGNIEQIDDICVVGVRI